MYTIGEFSKITNLTLKALRYYDEENILKSQRTSNNYRCYSESDIQKAKLILFLKKFQFSIQEIKDVLFQWENEDDLSYFLQEKKFLIQEHVEKEKKLLKEIDTHISQIEKEVKEKMYEVKVKEVKDVLAICKRFKGDYSDVSKYVGSLYKDAKSDVNGPCFNLYYDGSYEEKADILLCVPLKKRVESSFEIKTIAGGKMLSTIHEGNYETINMAYKAIIDYANEFHYEIDIPSRLIYEKGPGMIFKGNPEHYITEVLIPIKEKH